jgi:hypothetical protein
MGKTGTVTDIPWVERAPELATVLVSPRFPGSQASGGRNRLLSRFSANEWRDLSRSGASATVTGTYLSPMSHEGCPTSDQP